MPGRRGRLLVATEAVVQDRRRPVRVGRRHPLPSGHGLLDRIRDQRRRLGFPPLQGPEPQRGERREAAPGRRRHAVALRNDQRGICEVADPRTCYAQRGEVERQFRKHAGVADELDLSRGDREQALLVPDGAAGPIGYPAPAQDVLHGDLGDRVRRSLQRRRRGRAPLGFEQGKPVEQQVEWTRRARWPREDPDGAADLQEDVSSREVAGSDRRTPGGQVGLPREFQVERLQPPGGVQQQMGSIAAATRGKGDLAAHQVHPGALELVECSGLRRSQEPERRVERAGLEAGLRRGQGALRPPSGVESQRDRALQERGGGGDPAASLRPAGRALQLGGDLLVRPGGGLGPVPGATVRIKRRIGGLGQGAMHLLAFLERGRPVGRRPDQGMPEQHPGADLQQAGLGRRGRRRSPDPQPLGGLPHQHRIPHWVGRRDQQQRTGLFREALEPPPEARLDPACERHRVREGEPARQLRRRQPPGQLQQRQRVATRSRPAADPGPARPAARSAPPPAAPAHRPPAGPRPPAPATPPTRRRERGPRTPGRPTRRPGGGPRTQGPGPRR